MGSRPDIPVERAKALRNTGMSWKMVAKKLHAEGYPLFWAGNICKACRNKNHRKATYSIDIPLETIRDLRFAGFKWKEIPDLLIAKGWPRWHPSTLCGAFKGSPYDISC